MIIDRTSLDALRTGFKASFQGGFGQAAPQYTRVATIIAASTKEQKYGWLGKVPTVREWIGPRALQNLQEHDYAIKEKPWELTIAVDRDDIETDNLGIYKPMFEEMGSSAGSHYDLITFSTLKKGFELPCYDGQAYFDTDHPVLDADGNISKRFMLFLKELNQPLFLFDQLIDAGGLAVEKIRDGLLGFAVGEPCIIGEPSGII